MVGSICPPNPTFGDDTGEGDVLVAPERACESSTVKPKKKDASEPSHGLSAAATSALEDIFIKFDENNDGFLELREVEGALATVLSNPALAMQRLLPGLQELQVFRPELFATVQDNVAVSLDCFKLLSVSNLEFLSADARRSLMVFRAICATEMAKASVARAVLLDKEDLVDTDYEGLTLLSWLEPMVAIVIIVNSISIGISLDFAPESPLWRVLEIAFTSFFVLELILKCYVFGIAEYFVGMDWKWNLFDFVIVCFALYDILMMLMNIEKGTLGQLTLLRVARLLRITRLVRLFRIKALRELTLMLNGILSGLRTLLWSFVLLIFLVYALAVLMYQIMASWKEESDCNPATSQASSVIAATCSACQTLMDVHYEATSGSLFRTSHTILRCFVGDCSYPDGLPIEPCLTELFGPTFVVFYSLVYLFVLFGIFNMIAAVFVENTIQNSTKNALKRQNMRRKEQLRLAHELHSFIRKICNIDAPMTSSPLKRAPTVKGLISTTFRKIVQGLRVHEQPDVDDNLEHYQTQVHTMISKDLFETGMRCEEADDLLERLDVAIPNRGKLFDVLDASGDGFLSIDELVDGIMRLRGPADKGDVVCASLMIRNLQETIKNIKTDMLQLKFSSHKSHQW
eukprot:TRINITY_DN19893_c0_g3_i1.p1 TRINITY_DN19893_c0_g3~~TRINITY_DN19893_c0_g3_i1.p1  ORF type:complete len:737 (-),score=90.19 TRINITY_DN19893_c0_g3_i1:36-1925(-)